MAKFSRLQPCPDPVPHYRQYRELVRQDFRMCCAYCLLGEILASGTEGFDLDHFRPKWRFPDLAKDYYNLYYACHVCNWIKGGKWPPPKLEQLGVCFVDLCSDDWDQHYQEREDGCWVGRTLSGQFTIDALRLNRAHLVEIRALIRAGGGGGGLTAAATSGSTAGAPQSRLS